MLKLVKTVTGAATKAGPTVYRAYMLVCGPFAIAFYALACLAGTAQAAWHEWRDYQWPELLGAIGSTVSAFKRGRPL